MGWRSGESYSQDLRDRVLGAMDGGMVVRQLAATFAVSTPCIYKTRVVDPPLANASAADGRCRDQPEPRSPSA